MALLQDGRLKGSKDVPALPGSAPAVATTWLVSRFALHYVDWSTAEIRAKDGKPGLFVFKRDGILAWKLTDAKLPV